MCVCVYLPVCVGTDKEAQAGYIIGVKLARVSPGKSESGGKNDLRGIRVATAEEVIDGGKRLELYQLKDGFRDASQLLACFPAARSLVSAYQYPINQVWYIPVSPVLGRQRQKHPKFRMVHMVFSRAGELQKTNEAHHRTKGYMGCQLCYSQVWEDSSAGCYPQF